MRFGNVYTAGTGLSDDYARRKREIQNDPNLSDVGRKAATDKLDAESMKVADKLYAVFRKELGKQTETLNSQLKKEKADPVGKMRELLRRDMVRDANLSDYSPDSAPVVSDNARTMLILQAPDGLSNKITSAAQVQVLARRPVDWIRSEITKARDAKDIDRLELLKQAAQLRDSGEEAAQLELIINPLLERLHADNLSPEELEVIGELQALDKESQLLEYSFENFRTRREYRDYRQQESEPATILRYESNRGAQLGRSGGTESVEN